LAKKTTKKKAAAKAGVRKTVKKKAAKANPVAKKKATKTSRATAAKKATKKTAKKTVKKAAAKKVVKKTTKKTTAKKVTKKAAAKKTTKKVAAKKPAAKKAAKKKAVKGVSTRAVTKTTDDDLLATPTRAVRPGKPLVGDAAEEFRVMLLQKRSEITGDVTTLQEEALNRNRQDAAGDLSSMPIHMADLGSDNYELEFTLGLIEGERAILKEIDEALERIQEGTYGLCLATGAAIGKARLRAKPWAKYCYEYTLAQEKGQAHGY